MMATLCLLLLFPFLMAYAAANDLLTMLIPNRISLALVAAFVVVALAAGLTSMEIALHVAAGAATLCVTFLMFSLGLIGGGDAKLAASTALWMGFDHLAAYALTASAFGGALTLAIIVARAQPVLPASIGHLPFVCHLHDKRTGVPYGIALAAAALVVLPETLIWARGLAS